MCGIVASKSVTKVVTATNCFTSVDLFETSDFRSCSLTGVNSVRSVLYMHFSHVWHSCVQVGNYGCDCNSLIYSWSLRNVRLSALQSHLCKLNRLSVVYALQSFLWHICVQVGNYVCNCNNLLSTDLFETSDFRSCSLTSVNSIGSVFMCGIVASKSVSMVVTATACCTPADLFETSDFHSCSLTSVNSVTSTRSTILLCVRALCTNTFSEILRTAMYVGQACPKYFDSEVRLPSHTNICKSASSRHFQFKFMCYVLWRVRH
jgi:hypothetical protein